jgi:hypothetical protein
MDMAELGTREVEIIGQCLKAVAFGPFLADGNTGDRWWEFATLMGLENAQVATIAELWPSVDMRSADVQTAVSNAMANLLGYPHGGDEAWSAYISASHPEVERVLEKWRALVADSDERLGG